MKDDPLWIDVTVLMQEGNAGLGNFLAAISQDPTRVEDVGVYAGRLGCLLGITEIDLHIEEVTGADKSLDVVVDIFNRVNSGGTKLSKGDLALAKICADWPEARDEMKAKLKEWDQKGYNKFDLDWLLRSVNTVLTGEAKFQYLHDRSAEEIQGALKHTIKHIDQVLNLIAGRLGLDHGRVLFSRYAMPVMVRYLENRRKQSLGHMNEVERDKLLFWFVQTGMWGRFSGSTESYIDRDLEALESGSAEVEKLIETLKLWHGSLSVSAGHFDAWSKGARFYPVLYMMTRMGQSKDWGLGIELKADLLGSMSKLEVHHIFPRAQLKKRKHNKTMINALGNYCFLTKDTNLNISARLPEEYFYEVEAKHPGALKSQWIPMDESLWKIDKYPDFLKARRGLLADSVNGMLKGLLHDDQGLLDDVEDSESQSSAATLEITTASVESWIPEDLGVRPDDEEELVLNAVNEWIQKQGLASGELGFDYSNPETGEQLASFDLVWPDGLQRELSEPVALLLNEDRDHVLLANDAGYRCFESVEKFLGYIRREYLKQPV